MQSQREIRIEVIDDATAEMFRKKTPAERVMMAAAAHRTAWALIEAQVRRNHSDWTEEQIRTEAARRMTRGST